MIKFGTDGWRAVISEEFTFENVRKVAAAIALYLQDNKLTNKPLIVGYDARFLADKFAEEVVKAMEKIKKRLAQSCLPLPTILLNTAE